MVASDHIDLSDHNDWSEGIDPKRETVVSSRVKVDGNRLVDENNTPMLKRVSIAVPLSDQYNHYFSEGIFAEP